MNYDKLPIFLFRVNNIPAQHAYMFGSNMLADKVSEYFNSSIELGDSVEQFIEKAEWKIKLVNDDRERKQLINFKRDVFNLRPRMMNQLEKLEQMLKQYDLYILAVQVRNQLERNHHLRREIESVLEDQRFAERTYLYDAFIKETSLMNSLKFIQATIMEKARSYFAIPVEKHGVKQRKLDSTLLKVLTRGALKTSPFSTLTKVGVGAFTTDALRNESKNGHDYTVTNINIAYILRVFEKLLLRPAIMKKLTFRFNETLTMMDNIFYWTTLADQPLKRKKIFRTADTLMKIKVNPVMGHIYEHFKGKQKFSYQELESSLSIIGINSSQALQYLTKLIVNDFIQPTIALEEQNNDILVNFIHLIEKLNVLAEDNVIKEVHGNLVAINEELERFDELDVRESYRSFEVITDLFKQIAQAVHLPPLDEKLLLYQDYLTKQKKYIDQTEWNARDNTLVTFQRLSVLFDAVLRLQYILGRFVLEKYGEKRVAFHDNEHEDVMEVLLNAILEHAGQIWGNQFNETEITSNIEEINQLDRAKNRFIQQLKTLAESNSDVVHISKAYVEELISSMNLDLSHYVQSNSFFIQKDERDGFLVLNNMYGGYLSYYLRFLKNMEGVLDNKEVSQYIEKNIRSRNVMDIYKSYGFNANVRPRITEYSINVPNSRINDESGFEAIYSWEDLEIQYNPNTKKIDVFAKGKKVNILFLGSLMTRLIPSISAMLHALSANGVLFRDIGTILLDDFLQKNVQDFSIKTFPRIILDNQLVLSRKTWLVNSSQLNMIGEDDVEDQINLLKLLKDNNIPHRVFLRKMGGQAEDAEGEDTLPGVFDKPQYIDFTSPLLWNLFKKEIDTSPYFLLTEVLPKHEDTSEKYVEELLVEYTTKGVK
ncbi:lantibiotic dehydratase [Bacillus kwashiorkori]|uniref:lantibiotic dehydratase n=1 Tax=Bacillus kwashiorkori TaxID=1522318 RepID=UPI0007865B26|nr:lantibiotic dehydratase [Bacillus kwashiorkori]